MPRLFYAVDLPEDIKHDLGELAASLGKISRNLRPVSRGSFHTTLLFLGEQPDRAIPDLRIIGSDSVAAARPCAVTLGPVAFFPRVSFLTLTGEIETLTVVARVLADQCRDFLEQPENRPYKAHITIARLKENLRPPEKEQIRAALSPLVGRSWVADELLLIESNLTSKGPIYTTLSRFPFSG